MNMLPVVLYFDTLSDLGKSKANFKTKNKRNW